MQLIVLLSALLASLTGLVSGERPAEPVRVEMHAVAAAVAQGEAVAAVAEPLAMRPARAVRTSEAVQPVRAAHVIAPRVRLALKQSWLE